MAKKYTVYDKRSWPSWFRDRVMDKYWQEQQEREEKEFVFYPIP